MVVAAAVEEEKWSFSLYMLISFITCNNFSRWFLWMVRKVRRYSNVVILWTTKWWTFLSLFFQTSDTALCKIRFSLIQHKKHFFLFTAAYVKIILCGKGLQLCFVPSIALSVGARELTPLSILPTPLECDCLPAEVSWWPQLHWWLVDGVSTQAWSGCYAHPSFSGRNIRLKLAWRWLCLPQGFNSLPLHYLYTAMAGAGRQNPKDADLGSDVFCVSVCVCACVCVYVIITAMFCFRHGQDPANG